MTRSPLKASRPLSVTVAAVVYQPLGSSVPATLEVVCGSVASRANRPDRTNGVGLLPAGSRPVYDQV